MLQIVRLHMQNSTKVNKPWTRIAPRAQYDKIFCIATKSFGGSMKTASVLPFSVGDDFSEHNENLRRMVAKLL